jgi:hypothetical protein
MSVMPKSDLDIVYMNKPSLIQKLRRKSVSMSMFFIHEIVITVKSAVVSFVKSIFIIPNINSGITMQSSILLHLVDISFNNANGIAHQVIIRMAGILEVYPRPFPSNKISQKM